MVESATAAGSNTKVFDSSNIPFTLILERIEEIIKNNI